MQVEKAGMESLPDVAALFDQYRIFYEQESDLHLAREFIEQRMEHDESVIFLARNSEGQAVGFTQLYPSFSSVSAQRTWILNDLFVTESGRGQGVATALMEAARELAINTQAKGLGLQTAVDNLPAQKLYESLGYQRDTNFFSYFLKV